MQRWLLLLALLVGLLALVACAAEEKATPAPAGPTAATKAVWEQELDRVVEADRVNGCSYCGLTNRETERTFVGTECDGLYVRACKDIHACCRRVNKGPLPWDSDYKRAGAVV